MPPPPLVSSASHRFTRAGLHDQPVARPERFAEGAAGRTVTQSTGHRSSGPGGGTEYAADEEYYERYEILYIAYMSDAYQSRVPWRILQSSSLEMPMRLILAVVLLSASLAHAQAYKCVVAGQTHYQDAPCAGVDSRAVDTSPSSSGVTGLKRDAERMAVKEKQAAAQAATAPRPKRESKSPQWYRENCKRRRTPGGRAGWGLDC